MNCEAFQENLFEYLDETLSPDEKAPAQAHIKTCDVCRQAVEDERFVASTLSRRLSKAVETVTLDAHARQSIAEAIRQETSEASESKRIISFQAWFRVAVSAAAAGLVLIATVWLGRDLINQRDVRKNSISPPSLAGTEIPVHVSYSAPRYTFHQEGGMVVDALTSDTRVEDGALLAKQ